MDTRDRKYCIMSPFKEAPVVKKSVRAMLALVIVLRRRVIGLRGAADGLHQGPDHG